MTQRIFQVDAFSARPYAGNPAAVCILERPRDEGWMQTVAREMNLSETAFLVPREDGVFGLRWFTPGAEVELCGHATLASAHVLWQEGWLTSAQEARFDTASGRLVARRHGAAIELDFPALPPVASEVPPGMAEALGAAPRWVGANGTDLLAELASEGVVRSLAPDLRALELLPMRGLMVTSLSESPGFDFVSRFFAPRVGVAEDPVTGSAHCCLGPFWSARLGKRELVGFQASARGGVVTVVCQGNRVLLRGQAVTVLRGELVAEP